MTLTPTQQKKITALKNAMDGYFVNESDIATSFSDNPSDAKVASEKLMKDSLDRKLDKSQTSYKGKNVVVDSSTGNITFEDKNNHTHSQYLTQHQSLNGYLQTSDVKNNLTSTDTNKPLSALQGKTLKSFVDGKQDIIKSMTVTNDGKLYLLTQAPRYITYSNTKSMLTYENDYADISITVTDENQEIIEGAEVQFYIIFGDGSRSPTRYLYTDNTGTCTTRVFSEELSTSVNRINIKYGEYTSTYNMGREPNIEIDLETPL